MHHDRVHERGEEEGRDEVSEEGATLRAGTRHNGTRSGGEGPLEEPLGPVHGLVIRVRRIHCEPALLADELAFAERDGEPDHEPGSGADQEVSAVLQATVWSVMLSLGQGQRHGWTIAHSRSIGRPLFDFPCVHGLDGAVVRGTSSLMLPVREDIRRLAAVRGHRLTLQARQVVG